MEKQTRYNIFTQHYQIRYSCNGKDSRNHDLPAIRGRNLIYYFWCKNGLDHRMFNLPSAIDERGGRKYKKDGDYQRKNNLPNEVHANGMKLNYAK